MAMSGKAENRRQVLLVFTILISQVFNAKRMRLVKARNLTLTIRKIHSESPSWLWVLSSGMKNFYHLQHNMFTATTFLRYDRYHSANRKNEFQITCQ